jgi:lambda family phage portal protein
MRRKRRSMPLADRVGDRLDTLAKAVSPRWYASRCRDRGRAEIINAMARFGYDSLRRGRLQNKRSGLSGTGDRHLTEPALSDLRNICRDMGRNNPLVKGLLLTEADDVVGTGTTVQARSKNEAWNRRVERLFYEEMVLRPCDITNRFNFQQILHKAYLSYRRDGDVFVLLTDAGLEVCEGEQCGTPYGQVLGEYSTVTNGVVTSNQTRRVIGYYMGRPNTWGYIEPDSWYRYPAEKVHHVSNSDRFSYTRGEPALTPSVEMIDQVSRYIDAELVAAHVNACLSVFVTHDDDLSWPTAYTEGISPSGKTEKGTKLQKVTPGMIHHLAKGESINAVVPTRPAAAFDPFILRGLMMIGRPLCMPLMLVTLDFSGATYMNARIAYQAAQRNYRREQAHVIEPLVRRIWGWWLARKMAAGQVPIRQDAFAHEVICQRWPYVDPYREAQADKLELENKTTSQSQICARKGLDYADLVAERQRDRQTEIAAGERSEEQPPKTEESDDAE